MEIHLCCMVRDEIDILPVFLEHHLRLFDRLTIIDHRSSDGTRELLQHVAESTDEPPLEVLTYDDEAYHQSELSTFVARRAFERGADWVLVLDADELLDVPSRRALERALDTPHPVVNFSWTNIMPAHPPTETGGPLAGRRDTLRAEQEFVTLSAGTPREKGKVAIGRAHADRHPDFRLPIGNHQVVPNPFPGRPPRAGRLLHLPARSVPQAMRKIANQIRSLDELGGDYAGDKVYRDNLRLLTAGPGADPDTWAREALEAVVLWYESREVRAQHPGQRDVGTVRLPDIPPVHRVREALERVLAAPAPSAVDPRTALRSRARRQRSWPLRVLLGEENDLRVVPELRPRVLVDLLARSRDDLVTHGRPRSAH